MPSKPDVPRRSPSMLLMMSSSDTGPAWPDARPSKRSPRSAGPTLSQSSESSGGMDVTSSASSPPEPLGALATASSTSAVQSCSDTPGWLLCARLRERSSRMSVSSSAVHAVVRCRTRSWNAWKAPGRARASAVRAARSRLPRSLEPSAAPSKKPLASRRSWNATQSSASPGRGRAAPARLVYSCRRHSRAQARRMPRWAAEGRFVAMPSVSAAMVMDR
mmetsp:Transcript_31180/g.99037  ORF Transcript_31180/g.99037 Transcript_31180/m.99037 type:complete len:219 (+) Transcript_31180:595-1251(+)